VVDKLEVLSVLEEHAVANLVGVDQTVTTAEMVARVNVEEVEVVEEAVVVVEEVTLVDSSPGTLSTKCSSIAMIVGVRGEAFTPMTLLFQLRKLSPTSPTMEIPPLKKERLLLSLDKLLMKQPVDGQVHLMVQTLGDTALSGNEMLTITVNQALNFHVVPVNNIMVGVRCRSLGITTMDNVEEQLVLTCSIIQTSLPLTLLYPSSLLCGFG
jgi:hypothetical protein